MGKGLEQSNCDCYKLWSCWKTILTLFLEGLGDTVLDFSPDFLLRRLWRLLFLNEVFETDKVALECIEAVRSSGLKNGLQNLKESIAFLTVSHSSFVLSHKRNVSD